MGSQSLFQSCKIDLKIHQLQLQLQLPVEKKAITITVTITCPK